MNRKNLPQSTHIHSEVGTQKQRADAKEWWSKNYDEFAEPLNRTEEYCEAQRTGVPAEPTTRQAGAGHTHSAPTDGIAEIASREPTPLASLLAAEARDGREEADRDAAAVEHAKEVDAADRIAATTAPRTKERRGEFLRAADAAGQGEMFWKTGQADEPARDGEIVSIRWGRWEWDIHGFWLLMNARVADCATVADHRTEDEKRAAEQRAKAEAKAEARIAKRKATAKAAKPSHTRNLF